MANVDEYIKLVPIIVNGKAVISVPVTAPVPCYVVRIWARAREGDVILRKGVSPSPTPIPWDEMLDVAECNEFVLIRREVIKEVVVS